MALINLLEDTKIAMGKVSSEAWVLYSGRGGREPGQLVRERFTFPDISAEEVLARPLYGCWEGNMEHAIKRNPVDVCVLRGEERVVLGNAGVVQVVRVGKSVETVKEGDVCLVFCNGIWDEHGYPMKILGYDAPQTMGVLAKTMKLHQKQVIPIPPGTPYSLPQWAAFSLRYITAWANWRVAYDCWRSQMGESSKMETVVYAWGGGVSLAELTLAKAMGCQASMIASKPARLDLLKSLGLEAIDRSSLSELNFEKDFLDIVSTKTKGRGVSIFVDNIGAYFKLTLKALARQGVITTSGWKQGMTFPISRAMECISRHIHVHTHYARYSEGLEAVKFAQEHGWMAPVEDTIYSWDDIPQLAEDYSQGRINTYFPIFSINEQSAEA